MQMARKEYDEALKGDAAATFSYIATLPNRFRGTVVAKAFVDRMPPAAFRKLLSNAWDHDWQEGGEHQLTIDHGSHWLDRRVSPLESAAPGDLVSLRTAVLVGHPGRF
jgi:hypothetical protein